MKFFYFAFFCCFLSNSFNVNCQNYNINRFLKFGPKNGDFTFNKTDDSVYLGLSMPLKYFGVQNGYDRILINTNGFISFRDTNILDSKISRLPSLRSIIAPFFTKFNLNTSGNIFYRIINQSSTDDINKIKSDVLKLNSSLNSFDPKLSVVVTWFQMNSNLKPSLNVSFQAILTTNGIETFLIYNYDSFDEWPDENTIIGYSTEDKMDYYLNEVSLTKSISEISKKSNIAGLNGKWIFQIGKSQYVGKLKNFLEFGENVGDLIYEFRYNNQIYPFSLKTPVQFFGSNYSSIYVNNLGFITFRETDNDFWKKNKIKDFNFPIVAPFLGDVLFVTQSLGKIFFRETTQNSSDFNQIKSEISKWNTQYSNFSPKSVVIITWYKSFEDETSLFNLTIQAIFTTDGTNQFLILNYDKTYWNRYFDNEYVEIGFNAIDGFNNPVYSLNLPSSNNSIPEKIIFRIDKSLVNLTLKNFVKFGKYVGDSILPKPENTMEYSLKSFKPISFCGLNYTSIIIGSTGYISFTFWLSDDPATFPIKLTSISPYWSKSDLNTGGTVFYRLISESNSSEIIQIKSEIIKIYPSLSTFLPTTTIIATWYQIAESGGNPLINNTFQAILTSNGQHTFAIFNYDQLNWPVKGSNRRVGIGFNSENGTKYYTNDLSFTNNVTNINKMSNVNVPGKFIYKIDTSIIVQPSSGSILFDKINLFFYSVIILISTFQISNQVFY